MAKATIYLGNKNYSSWSLRGWLMLSMSGLAFDEVVIPLDQPDTAETIVKYSPSGRVPVLTHGDLRIWDSLAIGEYLAEICPKVGLWPTARRARARARSVSAEMHAGFAALREALPMNMRRSFPGHEYSREVQAEINRITAIWRDCRNQNGEDGPFLFGGPGIADAMFAPVASRFRTYGIDLDETAASYLKAIHGLPAMKRWTQAAKNEPMVNERYEFD
jgi:glutathione S-transferase